MARTTNDKRRIRTRAGTLLELDAPKIVLSTLSGHQVVLDEGEMAITLKHANGSVIRLSGAGEVEIQSAATVEITAAAVNVHAPSATFDGIVTCTTLIASSGVVSPSYTPGAGNVW